MFIFDLVVEVNKVFQDVDRGVVVMSGLYYYDQLNDRLD